MADDAEDPLAPGLYLVATPIGNLGDITLRALDVLRRVDRIACEDTRQTQKLLNHFQIATPTVSCHQHNERQRTAELMQRSRPAAASLWSPTPECPASATPAPGWLPKPSPPEFLSSPFPAPMPPSARSSPPACLPASSTSSAFCRRRPGRAARAWKNWPPRQGNQQPAALSSFMKLRTAFSTPWPISKPFGARRRVVVARELTKIHEEFLRGP